MKFKSSSLGRKSRERDGSAVDMLVLMFAAILLSAWILGTLFLSFFPSDGQQATSGMVASGNAGGDQSSASGLEDPNADGGSETADGANAGGGTSEPEAAGFGAGSGIAVNAGAAGSEEMSAEIESLQGQISQLKGDVKSRDQQITKLSNAATVAGTAGTGGDEMSAENKLLQGQIGQLQTDVKSKDQQITTLTQERDQITKQLKARQAEVQQMQSRGGDAGSKEELTKLAAERDNAVAKLDSQQKQLQLLKSDLAKAIDAEQSAKQELAIAQAVSTPIARSTPIAGASGSDTTPTPDDGSGVLDKPLEYRTWTSSRGSEATLAFVRWENDRVIVVNKDGKEFRLTLNRLSPADQAYVDTKR